MYVVVTVTLIESSCKTDVLARATTISLFCQRYVVLHSVKTEGKLKATMSAAVDQCIGVEWTLPLP